MMYKAIGFVVWKAAKLALKTKAGQNRAKLGAAGVVLLVLLGGVAAARAGSGD